MKLEQLISTKSVYDIISFILEGATVSQAFGYAGINYTQTVADYVFEKIKQNEYQKEKELNKMLSKKELDFGGESFRDLLIPVFEEEVESKTIFSNF